MCLPTLPARNIAFPFHERYKICSAHGKKNNHSEYFCCHWPLPRQCTMMPPRSQSELPAIMAHSDRQSRTVVNSFAVSLTIIVVTSAAFGQTTLPANATAALDNAFRQGGGNVLISTIIAEISRRPEFSAALVGYAVSIDPDNAEAIADRVASAYPGFNGIIRQAAYGGVVAAADTTAAPSEASAPGAEPPWSGEIELGGSRTTGNSRTDSVSVAAKLVGTYSDWEHDLGSSFDLARDDGETKKQRLLVNGETRYHFNGRAYSFGFIEYEDDRFSGFDWQLTESIGVGYRLIDRPRLTFDLEAGPGSRQSRVTATGQTEVELIGRITSGLEWQISDNAALTNDTSVVVGEERTTTKTVTALSAKIMAQWSGKLAFEVRHNSSPPTDSVATDTVTKASLAYEF